MGLKGRGVVRLDRGGFEIAIWSEQDHSMVWTFQIERQVIPTRYSPVPTTLFKWDEEPMLKAFGEALVELGIMKDHGTDQELKATKYHLEDMRKLALK